MIFYDQYKLASPPYCEGENEEVIGHVEFSISGDVTKLKEFEKFLEEIAEKLDIEINY